MRLKTIILTLLLCGYIPMLFSQDKPICLSGEAQQEYFDNNPAAKAARDAFEQYTAAQVKANRSSRSSVTSWTIPVVVHVFGETQWGKTVTYDKVKHAIDIVNENFQGLNADYSTVDPAFEDIKSSIDVTFKLAKLDPNGASTSGVVFYEDQTGFGLNGSYYAGKVAEYAWDNYKYMNIYIQADFKDDGKSTNSGIAWLPDTADSDAKRARMVYNGQYLFDNYTSNPEFAQFTHEFGHFMNLYHTFNGTGCDDANGDYVDDTPKEDTDPDNLGCTVGATECGNLVNYENYMGYEASQGCSKMFTAGQVARMKVGLEHAARKPLWQAANLTATGVNLTQGVVAMKFREIFESRANDGSIIDKDYEISIQDATFALSSGAMTEGTHFTTDLPAGLSAAITVVSNTKLNVRFSGQVANHAYADNVLGKSITFKNAAITGGTASLNSDKVMFDFRFYNPFKIVYVNNDDYEASSTNTWKKFAIYAGVNQNWTGVFYDNGDLELEMYKRALVCETGTKNPTLIQADELISENSNWVNGGVHPDLHIIRDANYTVWDGKTAYIGFQMQMYPGEVNYGWFRIEVAADGTSYKLLDYAYNTTPSGSIKAGQKDLDTTTPSPTCSDNIQNGDETGVDCGGTSCTPCQTSTAYCDASNAGTGLNITNVTFGDINNTTSGDNTYVNHTNISTTVAKGATVALTIGINNYSWAGNAVGAWIDWNNDKDFEDAGEKVFSKYGSGTYTTNVVVPATATSASVRMRVRIGYGNENKITPCGADTYLGEVEDYTVVIGGTTPTPTCSDNIQNGDETGVDCGGTSCTPCTVTPTCSDNIQNGDETGVDCGGTSCTPCQTTVTYCEAGQQASNYIAEVSFGSILNTSQNSAYSDFRSQSTNVTKGQSVTLTVIPGNISSGWSSNVVGGWIDWNQDGDFEDAGEEVLMKPKGVGSGTATVVVPNDAQDGATRLRVRYRWWSNPSPCGVTEGDEVEDYTVVISGGTTPTPTCSDNIQNGDETGVDCGGTSCTPCTVAPTCSDNIQNGDETGVDCGGTSCTPCSNSGTVVYVDMADETTNSSSTWNFFRIEVGDDDGFGAWFSSNTLRLVNYGKDFVTEGATANATMIAEGVEVGPSSNFTSNSNSFIIASSTHTAWNGNSGYIGFSFKINGATHYGWFYATVAADGLSYTILDYAYNTTAGQGLVTTRSTGKSVTFEEANLIVFPNPFVNTVRVDVTEIEGDIITLKVYDVTGKMLVEQEYTSNPGQIILSNKIKHSGSYFMKIETSTSSQVIRIMKQ